MRITAISISLHTREQSWYTSLPYQLIFHYSKDENIKYEIGDIHNKNLIIPKLKFWLSIFPVVFTAFK